MRLLRPFLAVLPLVGLAFLSACASVDPQGSWVGGVLSQDAPVLASDMTQYVATVLPPGRTTLAVAAPQGPAGAVLEPQLEADLRQRGFAVAPSGQPSPGSHVLRYLISPSDLGLSVRLYADTSEATRLYGRSTTGALAPLGPFVVRE